MAQEEEIKQLRRTLKQLTRQVDEAKLQADEAKLQADEAKLQADEARLRESEERRLRLHAEQNTRAINAALQREREERNKTTRDQPLENYLRRVHLLNYYMPRLLPPAIIARTVSEGQLSKSTTHGRTDLIKKYYPLRICPWTEFPELCQRQFACIQDALGTQQLFPSASELDIDKKNLLEDLPDGFIESEAFLNERKSSSFIYKTLERPTQRIISAYLSTTGHKMQLYFDGLSAGWKRRYCSDSDTSFSSAEGQSGGSSSNSGGRIKTVIGQQRPKKILPDCLVLRMEMLSLEGGGEGGGGEREGEGEGGGGEGEGEGEGEGSSTAPYNPHKEDESGKESPTRVVSRVMVGEHKAFHRLRAAMLSRFLKEPMAEDFIVRLARKALMKKPVPGVTMDAAGAVKQSTNNIPGFIFFAYALAQTFHYMVTSGLEFGYMAAGESVSFLRVPRDEPTTLLYYTELFPQYCRRPTAADDAADNAADGDTPAIVDVSALAISKLCSLTLLALESPAVRPRDISIQLSQLAEFPNLPPSLREESAAASSPETTLSSSRDSSRRRRPDREGGDDGENEDNDGSQRGRKTAHRPRNPSPLKKQLTTPGQQSLDAANNDDNSKASPAPRLAYGSPLGRGRYGLPLLPSPFDPVSFKPLRPYCTHLCLRSLMQGEDSVDYDCPNVFLHLEAARRIKGSAAADGVAGRRGYYGHPIKAVELIKLVQQQLLNNVEQDCECLLNSGLTGAIGCLFRLTVTGFGYTLVAKGVQSFHAHRLRHEAIIYKKLAAQQGILIPVCLGVAKLWLPYPMTNGKLVTDMLLLSYAGTPLYSPSLQRWLKAQQVDVEVEAHRTLTELQALGVEDEDETSSGNLMWCKSAGRVLKIDFDHVHMWEVQHPTTTIAAPNNKKRLANEPPPGELVSEERRQKRRLQEQRHLTVTSLLLA